jgi:hypothetical protein
MPARGGASLSSVQSVLIACVLQCEIFDMAADRAAISFLVEGALLDWSALLLVGEHLVSAAHGGLGYMLFSIAMTFSRFVGDGIVARFGNCFVLTLGGVIALLGPVMAFAPE